MKVLEISNLYCEIRDYTAKFRETNKSISRKYAKFWQNPSAEFRGIPPKFREKNVLFRPISYFAKWPDTHFVATLSSTQNQTSSFEARSDMCFERPRPASHIRSAAQPPLQPLLSPPCSLLPSPPLLLRSPPCSHCPAPVQPAAQTPCLPAAQPTLAACCPCPAHPCSLLPSSALQPAAQPTLAACCPAHPCSLLPVPSPPNHPASQPALAACCPQCPANPCSLLPSPPLQPAAKPMLTACCPETPFCPMFSGWFTMFRF
jgi:hypothetical protein